MIIEIAVTIFALIVFVTMSTLGSVLLVRFFMTKADTAARTFAAAFFGPGILLFPVIGLALVGDGDDVFAGVIGLAILLLLFFAVIGYPTAHFATRKLDRLTKFNPETFE